MTDPEETLGASGAGIKVGEFADFVAFYYHMINYDILDMLLPVFYADFTLYLPAYYDNGWFSQSFCLWESAQPSFNKLCNIFFRQGYLKVDITVLGKGDPAKVRWCCLVTPSLTYCCYGIGSEVTWTGTHSDK